MSKIRAESALEKAFAKKLSAVAYPLGYRYRLNYRKAPGSPDIAFVSKKLAIFIEGDFWHGYRFNKKKSRLKKFWIDKIERNIRRDKRNRARLRRMGWRYFRFWEHAVKKDAEGCIKKVLKELRMKKK